MKLTRVRGFKQASRSTWLAWILGGFAIIAVAGAGAVGVVLSGAIAGTSGATVGQAVVIDRDNFTTKDVGGWTDDKAIAFNDDGTSLTLAAELHTGDVVVADVPLANTSGKDASAIATLNIPPELRKSIEPFWTTEERTSSPAASTTLPAPAPVTSTVPQNSDTEPAAVPPSGTAGINPQVSDTTGTTSSPGLASSSPRTANTTATTAKPAGLPDNTPRNTSVVTTNNPADVPGVTASQPRTANGAVSTSQPPLAGLVASRPVNFTPVLVAPGGSPPAISAQTRATSGTTTKPDAALQGTQGTAKWYTGQFQVDINADGVKETVYFALTDLTNDGFVDAMDLSSDNAAFGETTGGPLDNAMTGPEDDERISAGGTPVRLGTFYTFIVAYAADGSSASITSKTWFTATIGGTDLDGDGNATDTFHAALTDDDSDGIHEKLDLSIGDSVFGENAGNGGTGSLTDLQVDYSAADNTNDERLTAASETSSGTFYVKMGVNTFAFTFDTTPGGGA